MLGSVRKSPERLEAVARIKAWTHERFALPTDAAILVAEIACALPGCPPLETVVGFWIGERHHHFKIFKPLEEVLCNDLPPACLKDALAVPEGFECGECGCC